MKKKSKSETYELIVAESDEGSRLDVYCSGLLDDLSRNQVKKLNREGFVTVDGERRPDSYAVRADDRVVVSVPVAEPFEPEPETIPLRIVFEDDDIVVINKDAGLVVHPAHGNWTGTIVNGLLGRGTRLATLGSPDRPGIVHRLDKDTSGLIVVAKTDRAYRSLATQIKGGDFRKTYHAIIWGRLGAPLRRIDEPIARHPVNRQKMAVASRGGKPAVTEVFQVDTFEYLDYIRVVTLSGRTHQIRVHLSHISHPILGDALYGGGRKKGFPSRAREFMINLAKMMPRQALHASRLCFRHPVSDAPLRFQVALAEDMRTSLEFLNTNDKTPRRSN